MARDDAVTIGFRCFSRRRRDPNAVSAPDARPIRKPLLVATYPGTHMTRNRYIQAALDAAHYRILNDDEPHFGDVPVLPGAWASGQTYEECREKLAKAIDEWIVIRESQNLSIPAIDGLDPGAWDGT